MEASKKKIVDTNTSANKLATATKRSLFTSSNEEENVVQADNNCTGRQLERRLKMEEKKICTIMDICTIQSATCFEGDILVTYGPAYAKNPTSPAKAPIVHVDLMDSEGQMTITANITNQLIDKFITNLLPGASVRISDFALKQKTQYERGDADYCIQFTAQTSIETIDRVCKQQKLMPDTTVCKLIYSQSNYSIGTLDILVAAHKHTPKEYQLYVKDGNSTSDTAIVTVPEFHGQAYTKVQEIVTSTQTPFLLLKNVVRSGPKGTNNIKTTPSSFIDTLNDASTTTALHKIVSSNTQVIGNLKTKNSYVPPYQLFCTQCQQPSSLPLSSTTKNVHCIACEKVTTFAYNHSLQCVIQNEDDIVECNMHGEILHQHLPELTKIPFENYKKNMSVVVYMLRTFQIKGNFTIAMNNNITSIVPEDDYVN